jgi:UDP-N-acetylglucosamine--N-acetylmuramyl-(pentapeptide) pyrophosphoryl-undecaprenol N-acetylglucosamine transferase
LIAPVTMLVASAGGHLTQLRTLLPRLAPNADGSLVWVTYDVPQARSLLGDDEVVFAHHPTTKNLPNAVRNYRLARAVFDVRGIDRVISTGAAVSVPFMARARQLSIPCHYIESATRVVGPSLSGRLLQRVPGVRLYHQLGGWSDGRWQQGPSVFDGFTAHPVARELAPRRVLVSFGTHGFPFEALLERLREGLPGGLDVTWQLGSTAATMDLPGRGLRYLPTDELTQLIEDSDVVVGHAGVGLTLTALAAGKVPVLVPRRRSRGEHTDDHQVQLAGVLHEMGLAVVSEVGDLTFEHLERASRFWVDRHQPPPFELVD